MFAIYGTSGLMYRGPLEDLRRVAPSLRSARVRALQVDADRPVLPTESPPPDASGASVGGRSDPVQAYASVQSPSPLRRRLSIVAEVMTPQAVVVAQDMAVAQGWQQLVEQQVGQAPVVNALGQLVGLLTRAALMRPDQWPLADSDSTWRALLAQPISAVMVTPIPSVSEQTDLRRLALVLLETDLPGLPVVTEAGAIQGFVSRSDILRAVVHDPPLDLWAR